jgi:alkyldihydroxyacetonephosphate synthase
MDVAAASPPVLSSRGGGESLSLEATPSRLDAPALDALREIVGKDAVEATAIARAAYARDLWPLGHIAFTASGLELGAPFTPPDAVVRPKTTAEVSRILRLANERGFAVVPWGAGSGVCGGTVHVRGGVALDLKGMDRILKIEPRSLLVESQPGVNGQLFEDALNREGFTLGHFPSSIYCSTVGGWLAARGAGQLSTKYGKIEDRVVSMEVVLPTGEVIETVRSPRAAMGPDWNQLFVGSEGTLGVITKAVLGIREMPALRRFRAYDFAGVRPALEAMRLILRRGVRPAAVRLYDEIDTLLVGKEGDHKEKPAEAPSGIAPFWPLSAISLSALGNFLESLPREAARLGKKTLLAHPELANKITGFIPNARCLLILSFEGDPFLVDAEEKVAHKACLDADGRDKGSEPAERWWRNRYAVSFKQSEVYREGGFVDTMEVATTWDRLFDLYQAMKEALSPHVLVLAHFSHAYPEGASIYFTCAARLENPEDARVLYGKIWEAGMKAAVAQGAAVSHHHGIGLLKADALKASMGPDFHAAFVRIKQALDPRNILNPGKLGLP